MRGAGPWHRVVGTKARDFKQSAPPCSSPKSSQWEQQPPLVILTFYLRLGSLKANSGLRLHGTALYLKTRQGVGGGAGEGQEPSEGKAAGKAHGGAWLKPAMMLWSLCLH